MFERLYLKYRVGDSTQYVYIRNRLEGAIAIMSHKRSAEKACERLNHKRYNIHVKLKDIVNGKKVLIPERNGTYSSIQIVKM